MSEVWYIEDCGIRIRTVNLTASHSDTMRVTLANIFIGYLLS